MKKILFLVDNDRTIRMFFQEKLSLLGLEVTASNDREGLREKIDHLKPDILFMDMKRWEDLGSCIAFHYDMESLPFGYVVGRAADSKRLDIRVNMNEAKGFEPLELIVFKHKNQGSPARTAGDTQTGGLRNDLPHPVQIQDESMNMALTV